MAIVMTYLLPNGGYPTPFERQGGADIQDINRGAASIDSWWKVNPEKLGALDLPCRIGTVELETQPGRTG